MVKKTGIYEISFIYAQDPQKQKEEEKLSEEAFPGIRQRQVYEVVLREVYSR